MPTRPSSAAPLAGPSRTTSFDSREQEVFLSLWRTYDRLRMIEEAFFVQFDLTPQQYNLLRLLRASSPDAVPTLALAARLVSRAPDITRMLDKLEEAGFLHRERPSDNRRVVQVRISDSGRVLLDKMAEPLQQCHSSQLGHMSVADQKELRRLLHIARGPHEEPGSHWG